MTDTHNPAKSNQGPDASHLGVIGFDDRTATNATCRVAVAPEATDRFQRGLYVGIRDQDQGLEFLGRIVGGPYHAPADAGASEAIEQGYQTSGVVEVLGELGEGEQLRPTLTRPRPQATLYIFPDERLRRFLEIEGNLKLGRLTGHDAIAVYAPSENKNFLPRNVGIFGTVGSGKSNTAQVLVEEAVAAGWAVVLVDVEGEYVRMNDPSDAPRIIELLQEREGITAQGVEDVRVYLPTSGRSAADTPVPFKIPIAALDPEIVADVLDLSEDERHVLNSATERATRQFTPTEDSAASERPYTLQLLIDGLMEGASALAGQATIRLLPYAKPHEVSAASTLRSKLQYLGRTEMLDMNATAEVPELPVRDLLVGGRLSVLDVSETDDRSRNLAIAYVLQGLFEEVLRTPRGEAMPGGGERPPLLVIIEEVHTFVSRAAASKMRAVLDNLQTISRRGRKRWMALGLVSQQPNHVPDEIFELTNTRFIHQLKSLSNLDPIQQTTGSVDASLWETIPSLGPGRVLLTGPVFPKPLFVDVRPARSRRLLTG